MKNYKHRPCHHCDGTGKEIDPVWLSCALRKHREKNGFSIRELARRLGVSHTHAAEIEKETKSPGPGLLGRILKELGEK